MSTPAPAEDNHVHSTFSDGKGTIPENIAAAKAQGLERLTCVDHVRADTTYAPDFVREVRRLNDETDIELRCGLEAKILDTEGALDMPEDRGGADYVYAADHQVALADGPSHPRDVKADLESGAKSESEVVEAIVTSTANAVHRHPDIDIVIAHLFSILPKIGLDEANVPEELIAELAAAAAEVPGTRIEIDERWKCPNARTLRSFREAGVPIITSTDAHKPDAIGRFDYVVRTWDEVHAA